MMPHQRARVDQSDSAEVADHPSVTVPVEDPAIRAAAKQVLEIIVRIQGVAGIIWSDLRHVVGPKPVTQERPPVDGIELHHLG